MFGIGAPKHAEAAFDQQPAAPCRGARAFCDILRQPLDADRFIEDDVHDHGEMRVAGRHGLHRLGLGHHGVRRLEQQNDRKEHGRDDRRAPTQQQHGDNDADAEDRAAPESRRHDNRQDEREDQNLLARTPSPTQKTADRGERQEDRRRRSNLGATDWIVDEIEEIEERCK